MMASQSTEGMTEEEDCLTWTLDNIPKELFLHICSFLQTKFVINVLSKVCLRFKYILEDDTVWRIRLLKQVSGCYPLLLHSNFSWMEACCESEEQRRLWRNNAENMQKCHVKTAHFAAVDVVQLIEDGCFCVSGGRDRAIKLWNLEVLKEHASEEAGIGYERLGHSEALIAHTGWIWATAYSGSNQMLYTGSWDSTIKSWDLHGFCSMSNVDSFNVSSAVLCLTFIENILVSGSYDKMVCFFDPRAGTNPVFQQSLHRKAVLCITADEKFIISGSEDDTLVVYNRRAGKIHKTIQLEEGYPMSLSYAYDNLWIGDNKGFIHLVDPTEEKFELVGRYPSGHKGRLTGIQYTLGSIITCSSDKSIQVLEPRDNPAPITTLTSRAEFAGISSAKDILASANSDDSITVWMPKS